MNHDSLIVSEGFPFIAVFGVFTLLAVFFLEQTWIAAFFLFATVFTVWFFRNPERRTPEDEGLVISPADGKVIRIDEDFHHELLSQPCRKVSIFMNVFNVHVNRAPYSGTVSMIRYYPGRFLSADLDKASEQNERNALLIRTDDEKDVLTIQIAGLIARRIVCWVNKGAYLKKGERFGMIRFGSRLEVFLPKEARISVAVGDKVKAGETPLGTF
jgi:phosphatidylserine decarboxylase